MEPTLPKDPGGNLGAASSLPGGVPVGLWATGPPHSALGPGSNSEGESRSARSRPVTERLTNAHLGNADQPVSEASLALTRGWQNWGPGKAGPPPPPTPCSRATYPLQGPAGPPFNPLGLSISDFLCSAW